jgi:hypothetical protein
MSENQTLLIIRKGLSRSISVDEDRKKINYILNAIEDRKLETMVEIMVFNHILNLLTIKDYENRIKALDQFFRELLIDMFSPEARKFHIDKYDPDPF